jgi:hypothetical protein
MEELAHIPVLRLGRTYESLDKVDVNRHADGEKLAQVSTINAGIIRKDMRKIDKSRAALKKFSVDELIGLCAKAGEEFLNGTLPFGDKGHTQSADDYVKTLSSTSGLPHNMVRMNMKKIHFALTNMTLILNGLTRGLDHSVIDSGMGEQGGARCCFFPSAKALGLVMPSNSPAVNSLWLPAIPLKYPVIIKPGREEPWTPYRLIQALIKVGVPAEAFGFYPTDHEGAGEILNVCGRALIFGDKSTTDKYAGNPGVQCHGPGFSKILIGDDEIENWEQHIDLMDLSSTANGGRSCINASAIVVPKYGREIADALAKKLGPIAPSTAEDENARLSGFANAKMAEWIDGAIEADLATPGAEEMTAHYRDTDRKVNDERGLFLRPTVIYCESTEHPLYNREFLFPYVSVVEVPQAEMLDKIGPSLIVTAITKDEEFRAQLMETNLVDRLNFGPVPTMQISWDQPHEGNMFEFLYKRRSIEIAD